MFKCIFACHPDACCPPVAAPAALPQFHRFVTAAAKQELETFSILECKLNSQWGTVTLTLVLEIRVTVTFSI